MRSISYWCYSANTLKTNREYLICVKMLFDFYLPKKKNKNILRCRRDRPSRDFPENVAVGGSGIASAFVHDVLLFSILLHILGPTLTKRCAMNFRRNEVIQGIVRDWDFWYLWQFSCKSCMLCSINFNQWRLMLFKNKTLAIHSAKKKYRNDADSSSGYPGWPYSWPFHLKWKKRSHLHNNIRVLHTSIEYTEYDYIM